MPEAIWPGRGDSYYAKKRSTLGAAIALTSPGVPMLFMGQDRWDQGGAGDDVVVIANFSSQAFPSYNIGLPRGGSWKVRFNSDWNGYSPDFKNTPSNETWAGSTPRDGLGYSASVGIGPYSVVILPQ